ncbi:MAG: YncE family protein [bacterium]
MKKVILLSGLIIMLFAGCRKENDEPVEISYGDGVFIINQGNFTVGNSSLSYFEPGTSKKYNHLFSAVNDVPLGDVAQSMVLDDKFAYVVVNNSGVIHVINRWDAKQVGKITGLVSPRHLLKISADKAYVSDFFSTSMTVINPSTYEVTGEIPVGRSTEEMIPFQDVVFVANWSGYNQTLLNNKLLVIDASQDKVVDSVQVGIEPNSMVLDKFDNLWVLCSGGFENAEIPTLWKIDPSDYQVLDTLFFPELEAYPESLETNGSHDSLFFLNDGIFRMSVNDTLIPEEAFIEEDTDRIFMALGVDPVTGDLYVSNPLNYQSNGKVYRFSSSGGFRNEFEAGIVPGAFVFNY